MLPQTKQQSSHNSSMAGINNVTLNPYADDPSMAVKKYKKKPAASMIECANRKPSLY